MTRGQSKVIGKGPEFAAGFPASAISASAYVPLGILINTSINITDPS